MLFTDNHKVHKLYLCKALGVASSTKQVEGSDGAVLATNELSRQVITLSGRQACD